MEAKWRLDPVCALTQQTRSMSRVAICDGKMDERESDERSFKIGLFKFS